jgi:hypothetical protein
MKNCWASELGNCSDKISREHVVSQGIFVSDKIQVIGFPWNNSEPKIFGLSSLTAKILCRYHNRILSPIDSESANAIKCIREAQRLSNVRAKLKNQIWHVVKYQIDGKLFERWFLKTMINALYGYGYPIDKSNVKHWNPSTEFKRIAFGEELFSGKAGLYSLLFSGHKVHSIDVISFAPLAIDKKEIVGGLFNFRGFYFLLSLLPDGPQKHFTGIRFDGEDLSSVQLIFHNSLINIYHGKYLSHVIEIKW